MNDLLNCGSCGRSCGPGQSCVSGVCTCPSGTQVCNGMCVNPLTDAANCGGCGVTCVGGQFCQNGACACPAGQQLCSGKCTDLATDGSNCGGCGRTCGAGQSCVSGTCVGGGSGEAGGTSAGGSTSATSGGLSGAISGTGGWFLGGASSLVGGTTAAGGSLAGGTTSTGGWFFGGTTSLAGGTTAAGGSLAGGTTSTGGSLIGGATSTGGAANSGGSGGSSECPVFSFFVTSLAAMRRESGSQNGFGGDLGGLSGADELCRRIAEYSLPCAGQKVWRAFLCTSTEDAIDRVGSGPWYDRLGRVVSLTVSDLANTRPRNADPAIINDLPNEDGVPNHNPDGTQVDNHDTLTGCNAQGRYAGSANATCNDWTSSASSGKPAIGHSWPGGPSQHWIAAHTAPGCAPGVNLSQSGNGQGTCVGCSGGYGGIYCFALTP